jgi:hypothetical protein
VSEHGYKCAEGPYCERIFLHKFRHTFATSHLHDGIDIRTPQNWMSIGKLTPLQRLDERTGQLDDLDELLGLLALTEEDVEADRRKACRIF